MFLFLSELAYSKEAFKTSVLWLSLPNSIAALLERLKVHESFEIPEYLEIHESLKIRESFKICESLEIHESLKIQLEV